MPMPPIGLNSSTVKFAPWSGRARWNLAAGLGWHRFLEGLGEACLTFHNRKRRKADRSEPSGLR